MSRRIAFNRGELAGSFGDIGTDLPLIMGMIAINGIDPASTFIVFGSLQILTGLLYGMPMPVQPLKAIAAIMISTGARPELMYGAGLVLGVTMLVLSITGAITRIAAWIPQCVVRGIQFGLGIKLMLVATSYMDKMGWLGWVISLVGVILVLSLGQHKKLPSSLVLVALGLIIAWFTDLRGSAIASGFGFAFPQFHLPEGQDLLEGSIRLALPQIALSLGNSIIATSLLVSDLYPERGDIRVEKISRTYGLMNLVVPFLSGIPVCHGAGGLAGHYRFGARTGGSVVIYGLVYVVFGMFFSSAIGEVVKIFPFPILGVLLFFEGFALVQLLRHVPMIPKEFPVALIVGILIISIPNGFLIGMICGIFIFYLLRKNKITL
jgi:hypothetical protein